MLMSCNPDADGMRVRSVFISDLHLGSPHSQASLLVEFLQTCRPRFLYLVGDIVDGWSLRRRWNWPTAFSRTVAMLLELARSGTQLIYTVGNHDDFLKNPEVAELVAGLNMVEVAPEFEHVTADGRRLLVLHGDQFDRYEQCSESMERALSRLYDGLLLTNHWWARLTGGNPYGESSLSVQVKARMGSVNRHVESFEREVVRYAQSRSFDGVVCGHIHAPRLTQHQDIVYCNAGDWLENCTAVVESLNGDLQLVRATDFIQAS